MAMFLKFPHEICREIGSFLDYESRMNFNRVVELNDRYVKRLNSDKHNLIVKVALLSAKLSRHDNIQGIRNATMSICSVFAYLINTKDKVLFNQKSLINAMIERATYYSVKENIINRAGERPSSKVARRLVRLSKKLISKVKNGFT